MKKVIRRIKQIFYDTKPTKVHSFFDYSAREKTRIIKKAVKESNRRQKDLVEEYDRQFSTA